MDSQTLLILILVLAVGAIAYLLGERRALIKAKRHATPVSGSRASAESETQDRAGDSDVARSPGSGKSKSSGSGRAAEKPSTPPKAEARRAEPRSDSKEKAAEESSRSSAPPSGGAKPLTVVPPRAANRDGIVRLDTEDDDEVDPTKIGRGASAPPSIRIVIQAPVKKIDFDEVPTSEEPKHRDPLFLVHATVQTDKGLRRKRNEDSIGVLESRNLFIVADGMGGYAGGDHASKLSVETIVDAFRTNSFEGKEHPDLPRDASELARAIQMANASIKEEADRTHALSGMGTTVCAAVFSPNRRRVYIGHVGDSRCYRLRDDVFKQMTADHTMAELGVKGPEGQALSRAVGIWPTVDIDIVTAVPKTGDVYLLCSDGLTKMLPDDIIANVLRHEEDPKVAVERLIFFANSRGGKDNISVVLIRVVPTDWKPKPSEPFRPASSPPPSTHSPVSSQNIRVPAPTKKTD
jgi:protein phosphatase